jgi:pimeloyl-ACP methyl ester carboxylesterase
MYVGRTDVEEGKVLGHENMGEVIEVGDGVDRVKVGDRVVLPFNIECRFCMHSAVFASAVSPYLIKTPDNPDGPLEPAEAAKMTAALTKDQDSFYAGFITDFFSANGELKVTEEQRQEALALCRQADKKAALACMAVFANTDFRDDLPKVSVPVLVLHGAADATVPFEGSGQRTHAAIPGSTVHVISGGPHGCNVSHATEWNDALLGFLPR